MVKIKRVYEAPSEFDGERILVDRLWPRGISKEKARISAWLKDVAPSDTLRKWFSHDPKKWAEFKNRYMNELKGGTGFLFLQTLAIKAERGMLTLLFAAQDEKYNNAVVLKEAVESTLKEVRV